MITYTATLKACTATITFCIEGVTAHAAPATSHIEAVHWKLIDMANPLDNEKMIVIFFTHGQEKLIRCKFYHMTMVNGHATGMLE